MLIHLLSLHCSFCTACFACILCFDYLFAHLVTLKLVGKCMSWYLKIRLLWTTVWGLLNENWMCCSDGSYAAQCKCMTSWRWWIRVKRYEVKRYEVKRYRVSKKKNCLLAFLASLRLPRIKVFSSMEIRDKVPFLSKLWRYLVNVKIVRIRHSIGHIS